MNEAPSRAVRLFGTDEPVEPPRLLRAGPLTAELEAGNLRYIRFGGIEMIRAISFIVRDRNWGTYNPQISGLAVREDAEGFRITYEATAGDGKQALLYFAVIEGRPDGSLRFEGRAKASTDFLTNRTGFVVLHPAGTAGLPASVEEVDGRKLETRFPELIDPMQPMLNLRSIAHAFAPGARVICRMEGDTFEMEDQRNWTDASYKTYVRPLALPWPYTLAAGSEIVQSVTLTVQGRPSAGAAAAAGGVTLRLGGDAGTAPPLGVGLAPEDAAAAAERIGVLRQLRPAHVICHHDARMGHDRATLERCVAVARDLGAASWLEAVVTQVDGFAAEIEALGTTVAAMGSPFAVVLLSPAADLKSTLPGSVWPPAPPLDAVYRLARKAFPGVRLGGGMFSYFTELNRKRPPAALLDLVGFTTSAMVHAGDDRSATESLEALPHIARSVRAFIGDRPYAVGPSAIGMRANPYGAAPMDNPRDIRQAMNRNDPRQRGLFGAAWDLGYFAQFANHGASAVTLGGPVGPFGLVHSRTAWPQAYFDEAGGLYPAFHVIRGLAKLAGATLRTVESSAPRAVQAVAARTSSDEEIWVANLTGESQRVTVAPLLRDARCITLDAASFVAAAGDPAALDRPGEPLAGGALDLDAYAVARIVAG